MAQPLYKQYAISRKETPDKQTKDRDKAATIIEEMWPAELEEIAEETPYSRQHVRNTISSHFHMEEKEDEHKGEVTIEVPDGVDPSSYLRGAADMLEKAN